MRTSLEMTLHNVRQLFFKKREWTKNEIAELTGFSLGTVTQCLKTLVAEHTIEYIKDAHSTGGRKSKIYSLNKDKYHILYLIMRIENSNSIVQLYKVNLFNDILEQFQYKFDDFNDLKKIISSYESDSHIDLCVISIPGIVANGHVEVCDIKSLEKKNLSEVTLIPTIIENDVNIGVIGLSYFYPQFKSLALIYQPDNDFSGCGLIIDHKLYNGHSHKAGELRYLPMFTEEEQTQLLINDPKKLLMIQIQVIQAVLDLELIGIVSDAFKIDENEFNKNVMSVDLDKCLFEGLYKMSIKNLGGIENEKLY